MRLRTSLFALGALGCNSITGLSSLDKVDCDGPGCVPGGPYELVEVGLGRHSTCVTQAPDGVVRCWGLHPGNGIASTVPVLVDGPPLTDIVHGLDHICGLGPAGEVYCWGGNDFGQLGDGTNIARTKPTLIENIPPMQRLSTAGFHTCSLTTDDPPSSFCWGWNGYGQLGTGDTIDRHVPTPITVAPGVIHQGAGVAYTCAVIDSGALYCWGLNSDGQLGLDPTMEPMVTSPKLIAGALMLERVYPSDRHTCGRTLGAKKLTCWGNNDFGQLGDGTTQPRYTADMEISEIAKVSVTYPGLRHTCVLEDRDSTELPLWCWGANEYGQLSLPASAPITTPTKLNDATSFMAGKASEHICYGTAEALGCVGLNDGGQLGDGTMESRDTWAPLSF